MTTQAPPVGSQPPSFDHGLRVSVACNGLVLVSLYSVVAYQRDIRARIPFLLGVFSPATWGLLFLITVVIGLLGLAITRGWKRRAVMGAIAGGFLSLLVWGSGVFNRLIPADYESSPKWGWFAAAVLAVGLLLWRERRKVKTDARAA